MRSGLGVPVLKEVWNLSDSMHQQFLRREEFYVACRLIAASQAGEPVTLARISDASRPLPFARFSGVPPPPTIQSVVTGSYNSEAPAAGPGPFAMTPDMAAKCAPLFSQCDGDHDGFVKPSDTAVLFGKSGLSPQVHLIR